MYTYIYTYIACAVSRELQHRHTPHTPSFMQRKYYSAETRKPPARVPA